MEGEDKMEQKHYFDLLWEVSKHERENKMTFDRVIQNPGHEELDKDYFKSNGKSFKYVAIINKESKREG